MDRFERSCLGFGLVCARCGIALPDPEDLPRDCPAIHEDISREDVKEASPHDYEH